MSLARVIRIALAVAVLAALASLPVWGGRAGMRLTVEICCYLTLAQMWNLLAGYAGIVSVGQQAWVGLGGYVLFAAAQFLGLNPLLAVPIAGLAAAVLAVPVGFLVFRLRGPYFAIGTWVVAEVFRLSFAQVTALGGGSGLSLPAGVVLHMAPDVSGREGMIYYAGVALAVGAVALVYGLLRRPIGLAFTAIRDSEEASSSLGVDTYRLKFLVWIMAAFVTACAGSILFLQKLRISPDAGFSVQDWTAFVIFTVVIGGLGSIEGPILGVALFFVLRSLLSNYGAWYLILLGVIATVVMLTAPKGLWGLVQSRTGLELFPLRRRLVRAGRP